MKSKSKRKPPEPLLEHEVDKVIGDAPPEDFPPFVWPGNDVDWKGER